MRICFFNRSYYPDVAATGQLLTELAEDLVHNHGCDVTVVAGCPLEETTKRGSRRGWLPVRREARNGVRILRAWGTRFSRRTFTGRTTNYLTYFFSACLAGLRVPRADVVVSLTDPPILGVAALGAARLRGARFVFLCQDVFPEVGRLLEDFHSGLGDWLLDWTNRFLLRKADRVVALGETMAQRLVERKGADPRKVVVIHNWADCNALVPGPKDNPFSRSHDLARAFVIMHSGNVGLSQDLETLIDAAGRLRDYPEVVVAIVGDGVKRASLQARARSLQLGNVCFFPYQPKDRLKDSFASADVFVVSLKSGLAGYIVPSKLYGILAAGRPCVAAVDEDCEVAAITRRYECGLLARPGDAGDLASKILTLYEDRALRNLMGANAREAALRFDRSVQTGAYYQLFRALASGVAVPRVRSPLGKRCFDVFLASLGLVLSAPLWALIALGIKLYDGGPVFYSQERVGKEGKRFRSWKFRSMVPHSDGDFGPLQARERDPRVTPVGRVLRATAMDELPQLWNILRGDMSFVGPRPLLPEEVEVGQDREAIPLEKFAGYRERHSVRPGLTGLAQVYAPRDIPRRWKFRLDLLYIKSQSFWLDLKLIVLSFWITFGGRWETRGRKV